MLQLDVGGGICMKNNIKFIVLYYRCFQWKQIKNKKLNILQKYIIYTIYIIGLYRVFNF